MTYRFAPFPMTLSSFEGHSCIASLFKCDISCSYATVETFKLTVRRAIPLRNKY